MRAETEQYSKDILKNWFILSLNILKKRSYKKSVAIVRLCINNIVRFLHFQSSATYNIEDRLIHQNKL